MRIRVSRGKHVRHLMEGGGEVWQTSAREKKDFGG